MRRLAMLLTVMGIMLAMAAGAALAINLVGDSGRDVLGARPERCAQGQGR